jgi:hypothetical protein
MDALSLSCEITLGQNTSAVTTSQPSRSQPVRVARAGERLSLSLCLFLTFAAAVGNLLM